MRDVPSDYVTDVPYPRSFAGDLSPIRLRLVAALNGFATPDAQDFDYCELGCGHGDTTAALAASYPCARFVGVDLNADHICCANDIARSCELENVRFLERDFEDLHGESLPDFDFITAHGVLSWIGPEKRAALLAFAARKLKPGGLLYAGYNALPGWAAIEPLRRLMFDRASAVDGDTLTKATHALEFAKLLAARGAGYFTSNHPATEMLATMERVGLPYVAHEYLQAHWTPMYFAEVARELSLHDLYFGGQLPLFLNYRDLATPPSLAEVFEGVTDRVTFETLLDYAINQYFRRDVYIKGRGGRSAAATEVYLDATPFGRLDAAAATREVRLPHRTLQYKGGIFDALLPAIEEGASTLQALTERRELAALGRPRVRDALLHLVIGGQVSPMLRSTRSSLEAGPLHVPLPYNRMVLEGPLSEKTPIALASRAAGTAIPLSMLHAVALRLLTEVAAAERPDWIRALLARQPFQLKLDSRSLADGGDPVGALLAEVERFRVGRLPKLVELGIVQTRADIG